MENVFQLIATYGFPIVACVFLGVAFYKMICHNNEEHTKQLESIRADSAAREQRLQEYLDKCQATNVECVTQLKYIAQRLDNLEKKNEE